ncbi:MAG: RidA family protein [Gemmatimonadaceae bacterium]|nr:RidA family protein [Gemmatimonadaceae bacterium]MCW5826489.1 RidA family protein [Gemmatimonadaceae bacterium]
MTHRTLQPVGWARPKGYANGVVASGRTIFLAGQIGWNAEQRLVGSDLVTQATQALRNIVAILAEDGAKPEHIVRLTWYVTDRAAYLAASAALGVAYREVMGRHFPAMTAVEVSSLMEADAVVEIEATAVVPA